MVGLWTDSDKSGAHRGENFLEQKNGSLKNIDPFHSELLLFAELLSMNHRSAAIAVLGAYCLPQMPPFGPAVRMNIRIWLTSSAVDILSPTYHTDNDRNGQFQACKELPFCSVVAVAVVHVPITNENMWEREFNRNSRF
jgi:hypothetical protein